MFSKSISTQAGDRRPVVNYSCTILLENYANLKHPGRVMLTSHHIRAARGLLRWSARDLAERAARIWRQIEGTYVNSRHRLLWRRKHREREDGAADHGGSPTSRNAEKSLKRIHNGSPL